MDKNEMLQDLSGLSETEKKLVLDILGDISNTGSSQKFTDLLYYDYKEIPVDIETFLTDDNYLGKAWKDASGHSKLYPFWLDVFKKIFPTNIDTAYNVLLESGARGIGKAQPLASPVFTEQGYRPMGSIKIGDRVYGADGKLHDVIEVFPQGLKPTYEIKFSDGSKTLCAEEHLWTIKDTQEKNTRVLTTKQIIDAGIYRTDFSDKKFRFEIPIVKPIEFEYQETLADPYFMGYSIITESFPNKKYIPDCYLYNNIESRISLLQGLMDAAGQIHEDTSTPYIIIQDKKLADDIMFLVESLGASSKISVNFHNTYKISFTLPDYIKPFRFKFDGLISNKFKPHRYISSITYINNQECQCIVIDSQDHLYLTDDLIVTHNSEVACGVVGAYLLYRVLCLKNPLDYFRLKPTEKICFAFMNIKIELSEEIALSKFQNTIQLSPWFMSKGRMTTYKGHPYWVPPEPISFIIGSQSDDVIGQPIYFCFFDEISFIKNQDIEKQKKKAKDMIDTALGGMMTRFIHKGKNPTLLVVASSKRSEQSFMESYIKTLKDTRGDSTYIVDKPVWEVKPKGTYSDEIFYVGLGDKYHESIVIPHTDIDMLDDYRERGYKILEVPIDFRAQALEDIDRMLCDYAGISSLSSNKYISVDTVNDCINKNFKNPFPDILEIGNGKDDLAQYKNFFDLNCVPQEYMNKPLFVHLDMSISGDMTGIAGVWIIGKKVTTDGSPSKDLSFRLAFSTSIKAPKGHQVSFEKNRNFIRWLREIGFKVKEVTSDTFQSYDLQQQLQSENFKCSILSVDRVDSDRICKPYQYLKSTLYEHRFVMYKSNRLFDEFIDIERNNNTGKLDHSPNGHKDALDAVCGATFTASKYAEEYAYDYGETLDHIIQNNSDEPDKAQLNSDFEQALIEMMDPISHQIKLEKEKRAEAPKSAIKETNLDFGMGKAVPLTQQYVSNGIFVW